MNEKRFIWTVGEHQYVLVPEVRRSRSRTWLLGAGMYSLDGDYVGYWARFNMPVPLIRQLTEHSKIRADTVEVPDVQRVPSYTRRVPRRRS